MNSWAIKFTLPAALTIAAALIEAYVIRNRKRKLSDKHPGSDKLGRVGGIERYEFDPMTMAQAEHRRLKMEGWVPIPPENETTPAEVDEKEKQDERR